MRHSEGKCQSGRIQCHSSFYRCKCTVLNLPIDLEIRSRSGERIKHFTLQGPQSVDRILLWIWRDLFVTLLTSGTARDKEKIPDMLEDIEEAIGVESLERLLYGGRASAYLSYHVKRKAAHL